MRLTASTICSVHLLNVPDLEARGQEEHLISLWCHKFFTAMQFTTANFSCSCSSLWNVTFKNEFSFFFWKKIFFKITLKEQKVRYCAQCVRFKCQKKKKMILLCYTVHFCLFGQVAVHDWIKSDCNSAKCQVCHKKIKTLAGRCCIWCQEMVRTCVFHLVYYH